MVCHNTGSLTGISFPRCGFLLYSSGVTVMSLQSYRNILTHGKNRGLVFLLDRMGQYRRGGWTVSSGCDQALALAQSNDVVILPRMPDPGYLSWLRGLGLGTAHIVSYGGIHPGGALARTVVDYPEPVAKCLHELGLPSVLVPWYSGEAEGLAAHALGLNCFGSPAEVSQACNDRLQFKQWCQTEDLPVLPGASVVLENRSPWVVERELEERMVQFGDDAGRVLVRSGKGGEGFSLVFSNDRGRGRELYETLSYHGIDQVLVEPLVEASAFVENQWIMGDGCANQGWVEQVRSMNWGRNTCLGSRDYFPPLKSKILRISDRIVSHMADRGYVGPMGIDYVLDRNSRLFPLGVRARFSGAAHARLLVENLAGHIGPIHSWKSIQARVAPSDFLGLYHRLGALIYDGKARVSVFPWGCDTLEYNGHVGLLLLARDIKGIARLESALEDCGVAWNKGELPRTE